MPIPRVNDLPPPMRSKTHPFSGITVQKRLAPAVGERHLFLEFASRFS